jgi:hypothetical protein
MNRRQLLLRGALLAALAPVVRAAGAGSTGTAGDAASVPLLAVHDPAYRRSREFAAALHERGARVIALEPDVLAAWHHVLRAACADCPSARLTGLTTRTDYLVLRDLARSTGLSPLATRDADAGSTRRRATLIAWVLAPRATGA